MEKRSAWLDKHLGELESTGDPVMDGYRFFYEVYLDISIPDDGEVISRTNNELVLRWWNPCPTLDACRESGLDTRQVCRQAYHRPVQLFLSRVHPKLRFERNYQAIMCSNELILFHFSEHKTSRRVFVVISRISWNN